MLTSSSKCYLLALLALLAFNCYFFYWLYSSVWVEEGDEVVKKEIPIKIYTRQGKRPILPITYSPSDQRQVDKILSKYFSNDEKVVKITNVTALNEECLYVNNQSRFETRSYIINQSLMIKPETNATIDEVCSYRCVTLKGWEQVREEWHQIIVMYPMTVPQCDVIEVKCIDQWTEELTYCDMMLRFLNR